MSRRCLGSVSAASPMAAGDGALSTRRRLRVAQRRRTAVVVCAEKSAEHDVPLLGRHGRRRRLQLCELAMQEPDLVARPRGRRKMGHRRRAPAEQRAAGNRLAGRRAWRCLRWAAFAHASISVTSSSSCSAVSVAVAVRARNMQSTTARQRVGQHRGHAAQPPPIGGRACSRAPPRRRLLRDA